MIERIKYLQHTERARIEHDLTLTRLSEVLLRSVNSYVRGIVTGDTINKATIYEGLIAYPSGGLTMKVKVTAPAVAAHTLPCGNVKYVIDHNNGVDWEFNIDASDPVQDRYDIIEAQIRSRDSFYDTSVDVIEPTSAVITPMTRPRDKEYYLHLRVVKGQNGQPPHAPTGSTPGQVIGTVPIPISIDLSTRYILKLSVGNGKEFVEIDCRGANPSATTRAEIVNSINAAGFGTIAYEAGDYIRITAPDSGENSVLMIKQPIDPSRDAAGTILGISTDAGYCHIYRGENPYFKVAEIFVKHAITFLTTENVRDRLNKDEWILDGNTIQNSISYEQHRTSAILDHPDGSILPQHLSSDARNFLKNKLTIFDVNSQAKLVPADTSYQKGRVYPTDTATSDRNGLANEREYQEQVYPRSRLDQKQETWNVGIYNTLTSINESGLHRIQFSISNPATLLYADRHQRVGFYVTNKGTGYERLTVILHNSADTEMGRASWQYAQIINGWVYFDIPVVLNYGETYHYHVISENLSGGTTAQLGTNNLGVPAFRELYRPLGGRYGGANTYDVIHVLDSSFVDLVPANPPNVDEIVNCGDGYSSATALDIMAVNFDALDWNTFTYNNYILVDLKKGRVKLPSSILGTTNVLNAHVTYNTVTAVDKLSSKEIYKHGTTQSLDDWLEKWIEVDISDSNVTLSSLNNVKGIILHGCTDANRTLTLPMCHKTIIIVNNTILAGTTRRYITVQGTSGANFQIRIGNLSVTHPIEADMHGLFPAGSLEGANRIYVASCDGYNWVERNGGNGEVLFTASTQWAVPSRVRWALITAKGGGGGGGGLSKSHFYHSNVPAAIGSAGGGAGKVTSVIARVSGTLNIVVGGGGSGGNTSHLAGYGGGGSGVTGIVGAQGGCGGGGIYCVDTAVYGNAGLGGCAGFHGSIINGGDHVMASAGTSGNMEGYFNNGMGANSGSGYYVLNQNSISSGSGGGYGGGMGIYSTASSQVISHGNNGTAGTGGGGGGAIFHGTSTGSRNGGNGGSGYVLILW